MTLITCPDCGRDVSSMAAACPHCGAPIAGGQPDAAPAAAGSQVRPWVRYWARYVDLFLAAVVLAMLLSVVLPEWLETDTYDALYVFGVPFLWIFAEAVFLSTWGTTPGKALLNCRVRTETGALLAFDQALRRSVRVWFFGLGIGFPLFALFTMAVAHGRLKRHGRTSWDEKLGLTVVHEPVGAARTLVTVLLFVGAAILMAVGTMAEPTY